jgi:hypothetical protein
VAATRATGMLSVSPARTTEGGATLPFLGVNYGETKTRDVVHLNERNTKQVSK